ncbi:ATP-dependent acyl-CoA ligase [Paraburkholderia ginsengiterrae]|uniref:ATP-dependent acyl-CoA ligase n=1 Tax=Paraburkholderia ginsengiterrae TaxID=1462993 RepID=A0A1A9N7Z3_9BURK|nr:ATP-dependent acyl-CoA ligase [Paraburkholderia ginsengiterrae]OAJ54799.1 ATP-dependent acyl-CoA ligase [Paraburkholderia ginsengiterrae]OAJ60985.1 ATP-dependent acyl-CoA ligase [Paraburkholderia ginsengiterrae]
MRLFETLVEPSICLEDGLDARRTLPALLAARAARNGAAPLFSDRTTTWTASEAVDIAARRAGALAAQGVGRGDHVALLCGNRSEFMEIVLGCGWLGAVVVPINTASRGLQLEHILRNCGARLLVAEAHLVDAVHALDAQDLPLETIWLIGEPTMNAPESSTYATAPLPPAREPAAPARLTDGDPFAVLYTSGTSGLSKGVICPHAQFYWWGHYTARDLGVTAGDVLYTCLPLFHTNALNSFFQALIHDAELVVDRRFSARGFFDALVETRATVTYVLGAMVPILLGRPVTANEREHRVRVALAPGVPENFQQDFTTRCGIALVDGYGSTETNCVISGALGAQRPGYMGKLAPGFDARVVDEQDQAVPDGEAGELILRADMPFAFASGYLGMPEKTVEAWRNLWFHTGDRVVRDADGYYRFIDRLKDTIRRRGENVSSFEVEQVLLSHPSVETAAVFAVKSALAEDEVMAAIVLREGKTLEPLELTRYCEPRLPYFAVPRYLDFVRDLPKTENGKIQKFKLRETGVTAKTWDLDASGYRLRRS